MNTVGFDNGQMQTRFIFFIQHPYYYVPTMCKA